MTALFELLDKSNMQFEHISLKNRDGTPVRCYQTGELKTWCINRDIFKLPVKDGMNKSFYINNTNRREWILVDYSI